MFTANFSVNMEVVFTNNRVFRSAAQVKRQTLRKIIDCSKLNIPWEQN